MEKRSKILELPPVEFGETKVLRKAKFQRMIWSDVNDSTNSYSNDRSVKVVWRVYPVNEHGEEIKHPILVPYEKTLTADNSVMVNKETGEYVDMSPVFNPDGTISPPLMPENTVGEYDFFTMIADYSDINITDFLMASGVKAVEAGRF